jgi:excisionase family DNA binding protein
MNYQEAADYLGVKKSTLRRWVRQRLLPVVRYGYRTHRFNRIDLDAFRDEKTLRAKTQ